MSRKYPDHVPRVKADQNAEYMRSFRRENKALFEQVEELPKEELEKLVQGDDKRLAEAARIVLMARQ